MSVSPGKYLELSNLAYTKFEKGKPVNPPEGWEVIDKISDKKTGYQGIALRSATGEVVIAHRGTEDWKDLLIADRQMAFGEIPSQYQVAEKFSEDIRSLFPEEDIHHTGHSLGGGLAQMVAYKEKSSSTAFEPLGTSQLIEKLRTEKGLTHGIGRENGDIPPESFQTYVVKGYSDGLEDTLVSRGTDHVQLGQVHAMHPVLPTDHDYSKVNIDLHKISGFQHCFNEQGEFIGSLSNPTYRDNLIKAEWDKNEVVIPGNQFIGEQRLQDRYKSFEEYKDTQLKWTDRVYSDTEYSGISSLEIPPSSTPIETFNSRDDDPIIVQQDEDFQDLLEDVEEFRADLEGALSKLSEKLSLIHLNIQSI